MWYSILDAESDLLDKCVRCKHQKVDHDRSATRDKMRRNIPSIGDDAKELIKGRIDKIERLSENDFELLIRMLTDLHNRKN